MDQAFITTPAYPPTVLLTGIIVNKLGKRFVTEIPTIRAHRVSWDQPDAAAYLIVDEDHLRRPEFPLIKFIDGWETVAEMEPALGIPTGNLAATLDHYNEFAAQGEGRTFWRFLAAQDNGPWRRSTCPWARLITPVLRGRTATVDGRTLSGGSPVPGLYAAGAPVRQSGSGQQGIPAERSWGRGSFFGRRAGAHPAACAHQA